MRKKKNMFDGDSFYAQYAVKVYKQLKSRKTVTYESVAKEYLGDKFDPLKTPLTKEETYGELKKAFPDVCRAIKEVAGENSIVMSGRNRCKDESGRRSYKYVGEDPDPLKDMVNARAIDDLKEYWTFCQDSEGFLPEEWLEYFMKDTKDLLEIHNRKRRKQQIMGVDLTCRSVRNKELVPQLYKHINNRTVLSVTYIPKFEDDKREQLVFHPHYLREFNGRWFLLGHAEGKEPENGYNLAVDRIENVSKKEDVKWCGAPEGFYEDYFRDIVGVSHEKIRKPYKVVIRAHSPYMFGLVKTCPLHHSQKVVLDFGEHEEGRKYGDFELNVELNKELIGRILQKGEELEVISPSDVREMVKNDVQSIMRRYES